MVENDIFPLAMFGILRHNCCTKAINLGRYDFISFLFFFKKTENDVTLHKGRERCCLPDEMKIARNILREYFLVLPWQKSLQQRFNIWKQFQNFLYVHIRASNVSERIGGAFWKIWNWWRRIPYRKFMKATHGMPIYFMLAKSNYK